MARTVFLNLTLLAALMWPRTAAADSVDMYANHVRVETAPRLVRAPIPPRRPANLPTFIKGRLVCSANVNRLLQHKGLRGTGSNLALSFLLWGRSASIQPGAVQVERRRGGGHVKLVSHHDGERWLCLNPSARHQDWRVVPCANPRVIGWRVA